VPEVMRWVSEGDMDKVWSISSRRGLTIVGKADSQGSSMPTRWTPWPGKKRAVLGRVGVVYALVGVYSDVSIVLVACETSPLACRRHPLAGTLIVALRLWILFCPGACPLRVYVAKCVYVYSYVYDGRCVELRFACS
jgi:hypothetical protein